MEDCQELYVDPEEDEVFFGTVSEKERNLFAKFANEGSNPPLKDDSELKTFLNDETCKEPEDDCHESLKIDNAKKETIDEGCDDLKTSEKLNESPEKDEDYHSMYSDNASVELDHNYSTPMKQKIDKSILATPKSVVKADKDGGFLQVLSEIALVKAEADADKKVEDEDKENKIVNIPEIKITEPSPEKVINVLSPPKSVNSKLRRFRIIYNSPLNCENVDGRQSIKSKSFTASLEGCKNYKNKVLDGDGYKSGVKKRLHKSIDLIDFNETGESDLFMKEKEFSAYNSVVIAEVEMKKESSKCEDIQENENVEKKENLDNQTFSKVNATENESNSEIQNTIIQSSEDDSSKTETVLVVKQSDTTTQEEPSLNFETETKPAEDKQEVTVEPASTESSKPCQFPFRFSKEAKKIVEVIKKATVDDTLNFTIQEIDVENLENSFISPEMPASRLDDTIMLSNKKENRIEKPRMIRKEVESEKQPRTVEKDRYKLTPVMSQSKIPPVKYFSDRRNQIPQRTEAKKCVKQLVMDEKRKIQPEEKIKVGQTVNKDSNGPSSSRIPLFSVKTSKIPLSGRNATKVTPAKTPVSKPYKNPKFNNIESPINAYIHNKPTALIVNVKPEAKKDALAKVLKAQTVGSAKKIPEKATKTENSKKVEVGLPFVEYKSATPYKVEKRPESRLPRLAPSVQKLIGSNSPRVIKHEGRFFVKTPRAQSSNDDATILADPNEVSVMVSQVAQKSNTIK